MALVTLKRETWLPGWRASFSQEKVLRVASQEARQASSSCRSTDRAPGVVCPEECILVAQITSKAIFVALLTAETGLKHVLFALYSLTNLII